MSVLQENIEQNGNHAYITCSICVITIIRVKETTDINGYNTEQQYSKIALLTCLEALLGVINACLPVTKPFFKKLGAGGIFGLLRSIVPTTTTKKSVNTRRLNHVDQVSRREGKYPCISRPRQIVYKDSLQMFRPNSPTDVHAPSIPPPDFSWRPLSGFYLPRAGLEHDPADLRRDKRIGIPTNWDIRRRPSEGDSPTLPWRF